MDQSESKILALALTKSDCLASFKIHALPVLATYRLVLLKKTKTKTDTKTEMNKGDKNKEHHN